jgi:hypothetical protein
VDLLPGWPGLVSDLVHRVQRDLVAVLTDLDPALLDRPVAPGANTIGWLGWHMTRSHDRNVSELRGTAQLWLGGWAERFGRQPDPTETGFGHSPHELAAFLSPTPQLIVAYHAAVVEMIDDYLRGADAAELDRVAMSPTLHDTHTVRHRLVGVLTEGLEHVGQMAFLKGVFNSPQWTIRRRSRWRAH